MKREVLGQSFRFTIDNQDYILTVDDESCDYACTFMIIIRESEDFDDLKKRLDERHLKCHLYKISEVDINEKQRRKRPTNQECLIAALNDVYDDGGASREASIYYNIACPYNSGDIRSECNGKDPSRDICVICKEKWLKAEVDE